MGPNDATEELLSRVLGNVTAKVHTLRLSEQSDERVAQIMMSVSAKLAALALEATLDFPVARRAALGQAMADIAEKLRVDW